MNRPSHIVYGVCMAGALAVTTGGMVSVAGVEAYTYIAAPFAILGSYLPDIDVKNSNMRKTWKTFSIMAAVPTTILVALLLVDLFGLANIGIFAPFLSFLAPIIIAVYINLLAAIQLKHRTYTHSYYVPVLIAIGMWAIAANLNGMIAIQLNSIILGFLAGYVSHLLADSCTTKGTFLAYPIPLRVHFLPSFMRVKTGTKGETIFTVLVILTTIGYCFFTVAHL